MPKRLSNSKDENKIGVSILSQVTHEAIQNPTKNPAAVALGRLGGLKGGKARADNLSKKELSDIGKQGAKERWKNHKKAK